MMKGNKAGTYLQTSSVEAFSFPEVILFNKMTCFSAPGEVFKSFNIPVNNWYNSGAESLKHPSMFLKVAFRNYCDSALFCVLFCSFIQVDVFVEIECDTKTLSKLRMGQSIALRSQHF